MVKEVVEATGEIVDVLPDAKYRVTLPSGHTVLAYLSGRMRRHSIRVLLGDQVTLELTPYDLTRGRIVKRLPREGERPRQQNR